MRDQVFLHWRVDPDLLRPHLPAGVEPDLHRGRAWLTVTALRATATRLRGTLPVPFLSSFEQVNVRAPVTAGERPGIAFLSVDANSRLAVRAARVVYGAPFRPARIELAGGEVSATRIGAERPYVLSARAHESGGAASGALDRFLVERFCLYAERGGRLLRAESHHLPWPLRHAEAEVDLNTLAPDDVELVGEPVAHVCARQDVLLWPLEPMSG